MILEILIVVLLTLSSVCGTRDSGSFILPEPAGPEPPECTSYSQLCNLAYNLSEHRTYQSVVNSEQDICRCPEGQTCETGLHNNPNSIVKGFKLSGHDMAVKMTYCSLNQPARVCRKNEEAIVMRGRGAFLFEIVQDFSCRCYRVLYVHRSWREGAYVYSAYSCGKPRCSLDQSSHSACARMRYDGAPGQYRVDHRCRCLRNQECQASQLPTHTHTTTWKTCQPVAGYQGLFHEDYRRKRDSEN